MNGEKRIGTAYAAGACAMAVFCLGPIAVMALTAVSRRADFLVPGVGFAFTAGHFLEVLRAESLHFPEYFRNSLVVSGISAALSVFVAAPAAYALARMALPGRMAVLLAVLSVSMFPQVSLVGYLFRLMSSMGWVNTYVALVLPYTAWTLPLSLWILTGYFSRIPRDIDRAALMDGCGPLEALRKVILPVAAPGVFSTAILAFIFSFNELLFALMLTTDHRARTIPVGIALFEGLHGEIPWGSVMAAATLTVAPVVVLALAFQRRIVQGLTRGAVKE
ncbi:MAG: carbohydrate ABC transporter permease [Thermodesulfobacteriota bacterium]